VRGKAPRDARLVAATLEHAETMANRALYYLAHHRGQYCSFIPLLRFVFLHWDVKQWLPSLALERVLDRAIELGLVSKRRRLDRGTGASEESDYEFAITDHFLSIKELMGLSTSELSERTEQSMQVEPIFDTPTSLSADIFVITPFASNYTPIFTAIEKIAAKHGFIVAKADQFLKSDHIVTDIWSLIYNSNLVICDCTALNPNVMYELGIAHALGKHAVLLTQDVNSVPFDLKHMNTLRMVMTRQLTSS
jgi:hypothetical protein